MHLSTWCYGCGVGLIKGNGFVTSSERMRAGDLTYMAAQPTAPPELHFFLPFLNRGAGHQQKKIKKNKKNPEDSPFWGCFPSPCQWDALGGARGPEVSRFLPGAPLLPVLLTPSPLPHGPPAGCCSSNGELHPDTAAGRALLGACTHWERSGTGAVSICKAVSALVRSEQPQAPEMDRGLQLACPAAQRAFWAVERFSCPLALSLLTARAARLIVLTGNACPS